MPRDEQSSRRTPPSQYGWAGGCLGICIGAVALPGVIVGFVKDHDLMILAAMLFAVPMGAAIGGALGAILGLILRAIHEARDKSRR